MGTKLRVWFTEAAYHVTERRNHRNDIFRDGEDFQIYLSIIERALDFYKDLSWPAEFYPIGFPSIS